MRKRGVFGGLSSKSKKGSLSLSMNAIVIVVLAFSMLGMGLFLTRSLFDDITETTGQVSGQIRDQILEDLRSGNKPLSFSQSTVNAKLRDKADIALGIKNIGSTPQKYCTKFDVRYRDGEGPVDGTGPKIDFVYIDDPQYLSAQDAAVIPVKIVPGNGADITLYRAKITVYEVPLTTDLCAETVTIAQNLYAEKAFFIEVN